jgi:hypothetical protein
MKTQNAHLPRLGVAVVAAAAVVAAPSWSAVSEESQASSKCPAKVVSSSNAFDALAAVRRLLIDGQSITSQGVTRKVTVTNTAIQALVQLAPQPNSVAGAVALRKRATKRCGARVAASSWGVQLFYAEAPMASAAPGTSFIVKTKSGWRVY